MSRLKPAPAPETGLCRVLNAGALAAASLLIKAYRLLLSPLLPPRCRHLPTCSEYALEALAVHGPWRGLWLTGRRLLRCHPWGSSGYDPVPPPGVRS